jgi:uncharacterized membrane protein YuzA (DUF378 family)
MSYRTFAFLCGTGSALFGAVRFFGGHGEWWQIPIMALVGFSGIYALMLLVWVFIDPADAVGVVREMCQRVTRKGSAQPSVPVDASRRHKRG